LKRLAVLIPFKAKGAKSRLARTLGSAQRQELSELLLRSVLGALKGAGLAQQSCLVSSDPAALAIARDFGARSVREPRDEGVNAAVEWGMAKVSEADDFMVVPSDLPLLRPAEVRLALELKDSSAQIVISPSRAFDGTNLLIVSRSHLIPLRYDDDSFWNHIAEGSRRGLSVRVVTSLGFVFDVDTPRDFSELAGLRINTPVARFARTVLKLRAS
jgi:2-phospho-L-lactate guanylyltransferase